MLWIKIILLCVFLFLGSSPAILADRVETLIIYANGSWLKATIFIGIWGFSLLGVLAAAFHPSLLLRLLFATVFLLSTLLGFTYEHLTGDVLTYDSLEILVGARYFAGNAFHFYFEQLHYPFAMSLLALAILLPVPKGMAAWSFLSRSILTVMAVLPLLVMFMLALLRGGYGLDNTPHAYRSATLLLMYGANQLAFDMPEPQAVSIPLSSKMPVGNKPVNIVFLMEESLRADFLDINYPRGSTPFLKSIQDEWVNFGYASSGANCSHTSNQLIRLGPDAGAVEETLQHNPYIWMYAKAAGYRTVLIEAQSKHGHVASSNGVSAQEQAYIDTIIYPPEDTFRNEDVGLPALIQRELQLAAAAGQPAFIYVVKNGVHFPYENVLTEEMQQALVELTASMSDKERLETTYREAIRYSVDAFFRVLQQQAPYENTLFFYTADHGQNLLDNGRLMTHCGDSDIDWHEAMVPFILKSDVPVWQEKIQQAAVQNKDKLSHFHIFPSLLAVMGFDHDRVKQRYGPNLFEPLADEQRYFMSGSFGMGRLTLGERTRLKWNAFPKMDVIKEAQGD